MNVMRLVDHPTVETQAVLRGLAAQAGRDRVTGAMIIFTTAGGEERCLFAGRYKPVAQAANAAMRICGHLINMQDDLV